MDAWQHASVGTDGRSMVAGAWWGTARCRHVGMCMAWGLGPGQEQGWVTRSPLAMHVLRKVRLRGEICSPTNAVVRKKRLQCLGAQQWRCDFDVSGFAEV